MKPTLVPLYFDPGRDDDFDRKVVALNELLGDRAEILAPVPLGNPLPEADAVVFPQLLGEAYRRVDAFKSIRLPILIITSEFGTLSMWDWEIISYLKSHGISTIAPYDLSQATSICNALRVKRELNGAKFLVYQDNPGEGAQPAIFKRFYWWEDECSTRMLQKFGVTVVKKSFRDLGMRAKQIPDQEAAGEWKRRQLPVEGVADRALLNAMRVYMAVKRDLDEDPSIRAVGINCLNESHFSDTTPCLAWCLLHQERKLVWGCEADTMSMLTQYMVQHSLETPIMMSNLYPFVLGDAALKHEHIERFPDVADPENHILIAHCGYFGMIPPAYAAQWMLRPKVLGIVNKDATAVDGRLPVGDVTLVKLQPTMQELSVIEGQLTGYIQYGVHSDCRNGGIIRVPNGPKMMDALCSHHYLISSGKNAPGIRLLGKSFDLNISEV
jgi:hypothetical protein